MLKGIDPLLTPELLKHLCAMGHGEWVAVVDANFTADWLAAGKPVVVQDTGWSDHLPSGDGAIAFSTPEEAAKALDLINKNYNHHSAAARAYAEKHFDAARVCEDLLS